MKLPALLLGLFMLAAAPTGAAELRIPAYTAYLAPNPDGANVSSKRGITNWRDPKLKVLWFGELKNAGRLTATVVMRMPKQGAANLRLTLGNEAHEALAKAPQDEQPVRVSFGEFTVAAPGYHQFTLEALSEPGTPWGDVDSLVLDGPAADGAHFNLLPRRNAASVHLRYETPTDARIEWFYCEVTAIEDPVATFYMACGFQRGYFGMQVNSATERRIIFSVWDAGTGANAKDRSKVDKLNQVSLVAKGEGVQTSVFGGEGTGGHSHLEYSWKTGVPQRFLLTAKPGADAITTYTAYYFHPGRQAWMLIASMNAPRDGGYLRNLHSFSENFGGSTGHLRRKALFGNQWIRGTDGKWTELTAATFSHDPTGKASRLDRFMGVERDEFFLSHGGFVPGFTKYGERFTRHAGGQAPKIELP